jgi:heptosyltransferase-3
VTETGRNILVCRTDALGDTILTIPVCTALKKAFWHARVTMLLSPYTQDIVRNHPDIDQAMLYDPGHRHAKRAGLKRLAQELQARAFDTALAVYPDRRVSWALWRAGIPQRIGTSRRWWSFLYTHKVNHSRAQAYKHEAEYNLDLVRTLGVEAELQAPELFVQPDAKTWADKYYHSLGVRDTDQLVIIHPGARGSSANWSTELYGKLADLLMRSFKCKILLTGSKQEQEIVRKTADYCQEKPLCLEAAVDLNHFAALLVRARLVIVGNTGPLHMACALGVPVVTLFPAAGVTGPVRWGPLGKQAVVITPPPGTRSHDLQSVSPAQVAEKAGQWLKTA